MAIAKIGSHVETNGEAAGSAAGWVVTGLRTVVVVVVVVVIGAVVVGAMWLLALGCRAGPVGPYAIGIAAYLAWQYQGRRRPAAHERLTPTSP
jgi:hypothetical protein